MSKVEISNIGGKWRVAVNDGPNLAAAIQAGGLRVEFPDSEAPPLVHVTFAPRQMIMNLDDALVDAAVALPPEGFRP